MTGTRCASLALNLHAMLHHRPVQAEEAALEMHLAELQRASTAMTKDPVNRSCLYLTDREVRTLARGLLAWHDCAWVCLHVAGL